MPKGLVVWAVLFFISSSSLLMLLSFVQQNLSWWLRALTIAILPAPTLAASLGAVAWILTNSQQWGFRVFIGTWILAILVGLPTQKLILILWRFVTYLFTSRLT